VGIVPPIGLTLRAREKEMRCTCDSVWFSAYHRAWCAMWRTLRNATDGLGDEEVEK